MRLEPDSYVSPRVRLVQLLRMGAVGSVWAAYHSGLGKKVAVKFMSASLTDDTTTVTRFNREGRFTAKISNPHIVEVYEQGLTDDGLPYIVMELLEGEDLSEHLTRSGPLSLHETGMVIAQLCEALDEAHKLGIIHRDIRLNNIFVVGDGEDLFIKLLDFGVAKGAEHEMGAVTATGAVVGTLVYISPEQFYNSKVVDGRTDLWSVAVVAYRALTGVHPFEGTGIGAMLAAVRSGVFQLPSEQRGGIPAGVDAWFKRALQQDPAERFQTAREMLDEFNGAMRRNQLNSTLKSTGSQANSDLCPPDEPRVAAPTAQEAPAPASASAAASAPASAPAAAARNGERPRIDRRALVGAGLALLLSTAVAYAFFSAGRNEAEPDRALPAPSARAVPGDAGTEDARAETPPARGRTAAPNQADPQSGEVAK